MLEQRRVETSMGLGVATHSKRELLSVSAKRFDPSAVGMGASSTDRRGDPARAVESVDPLTLPRVVRGPDLEEFERGFAAYHDGRHAIATSYGRMAFFYILRALDLPPRSEVPIPALTFWVVPEMARVAGVGTS